MPKYKPDPTFFSNLRTLCGPRVKKFALLCSKLMFTKLIKKATFLHVSPSFCLQMMRSGRFTPPLLPLAKQKNRNALTFCYRFLFSKPDFNKRQIFLLWLFISSLKLSLSTHLASYYSRCCHIIQEVCVHFWAADGTHVHCCDVKLFACSAVFCFFFAFNVFFLTIYNYGLYIFTRCGLKW